jgi:small subunit ribosomal protein S7
MSRRRAAQKREVFPDPKYADVAVSRFVSSLMTSGKKSIAEKILYSALTKLENTQKKPANDIFHAALDNVKPHVEVRSRRVGGATYQVPMEVRAERSLALSIRWIIDAARKRGEKRMQDRLVGEMTDAFNNRGAAVRKREETHRMADANKAFSHFRW